MRLNPLRLLSRRSEPKPVSLLEMTPPRTGERTLLNIGAETVCTPAIDALARAVTYPEDFTNCDVHGAFPSFSVEQLLSIDPEVIFVQTFGFGPEPPQPVSEQLADNVIWSELRAVQNGEVYEVDFFIWGTSRGIRGTNFVLDEALPKIYPELFPTPLP